MGDGRRGAVRAGRPAVVLLLAVGRHRPACPVTARGGRGRGALHVDHGDLQTRWGPRHVLLAARAAGHSRGGVRLADTEPGRVPGATWLTRGVSTPLPARGAVLRGPDARAARRPGGRC